MTGANPVDLVVFVHSLLNIRYCTQDSPKFEGWYRDVSVSVHMLKLHLIVEG